MRKKLLAFILVVALACLASACTSESVSTDIGILNTNILEDERISITANEVVVFEELSTVHKTTLYDGSTLEETVVDTASEGNKYLIVNLIVTISDENTYFNKSNLYIEVDGEKIYAIEEDLLTNHNYTELGLSDITFSEFTGNIIFEVPENLSDYEIFYESDDIKISVVYDETAKLSIQDPYNIIDVENTNITVLESVLEQQSQIEEAIYDTYLKGDYDLENPLVVNNPYTIAPLTALVVFDTEENAEITVTIEGKDEYTEVVNTVEGYNTHHEIPVLCLYAGQDNNVTITATYEDGTSESSVIVITTESLPDDSLDIIVDVVNSKEMIDGFTILNSDYLQMFDDNGDTRWYTTTKLYKHAFTILNDDTFLFSIDNNEDTYLYRMDLLGKIYDVYFIPNGVHHDIYELENGNVLITGNNANEENIEDRIIELDISTGEIIQDIDLSDIFDNTRGVNLKWSEEDWIHVNTIRYDYSDDTIVISGRNQDMVAKLTYPECEIVWIFADDYEWDEEYRKYLLTPIGADFEWFWAQHTPEILADLDNNSDTIDIMLFDNGIFKSFDESTALDGEDSYSRAVHYRINEVTMEVEQIWEYGKERGAEFFSEVKGDVDYYEDSDKVIITSPSIFYGEVVTSGDNITENIIITEIDKSTSEVIFECHIENGNDSVYRSERISIYPETWDYSLTDSSAVMLLGSYNSDLFNENTESVDTLPSDSDLNYEISELNIQSNQLYISAMIYDVSKVSDGEISLIFESEDGIIKYDVIKSVGIDYSYDNFLERVHNKIQREIFDENYGMYWGINTYVPLTELEAGTYTFGIMVEEDGEEYYVETEYYFTILDDSIEIENINIIDLQAEIDIEILAEYNSTEYTLESPYVNVNPYGTAPLSALVMFETEDETKISIEVVGKDEFSTIYHSYEDYNTSHQIPVYGLYELEDTTVILTATYKDGTSESTELVMQGEEIQAYIPENDVQIADVTQMQSGITLIIPTFGNNVVYGIDNNGDIRYVNENYLEGYEMEIAEDGTILMGSGDVLSGYYTESFYEIDFLGKVYTEYISSGLHHDLVSLPNGNYMYTDVNYVRGTHEDTVVEIDGKTGEIIKTWDFHEILEMTEYIAKPDYETYHFGGNEESAIEDWLHINAVWYDEETNSITISGRHQDIIVNIDYDTSEINWILTDPDNPYLAESMYEYLLTPIGDDFEYTYANHAAMITDEGTLFVFDNGTYRIENAIDNYSRAVEFEINLENMTVEQVWEYGKDLGSETFALYVSDVDVLENGNKFIDFGGVVRDGDGNASNSMANLYGGAAASIIIELNENGEEVFHVETNLNSYRANRVSLYTKSETNIIVGYVGEQLGETKYSKSVEMTFENAVEADVIIESATNNGYRLRISGTIEIPNVSEVYIEIDGKVYVGTISSSSFSFDIGTSNFAENSEMKIYYKNTDSDLFVDSIGTLKY